MSINFPNTAADRLSCGDVSALDGQAAISISAWVRLNALADWKHIVNKGPDTGNNFGMQESGPGEGTNNDVSVAVKDAGLSTTMYGYTTAGILAADGLFHHWCMVFDGTLVGNANRLKFYFDSVQQTLTFAGTIPAATDVNASSLFIAHASWDVGFNPNAAMDDVRTWARALSANEVLTLYATRGHALLYPSIVNQWPMGELGAGTAVASAIDVISAFNGAPTGAPVYAESTLSKRRRFL